jgi:hypothetical protein
MTLGVLVAADHHGTVKSGGLPVPGASVSATSGDQKLVTTTDENGRYSFTGLSDGSWTIEVEMLGFAKLSNVVGIAFDAPSPEWNLKFLPMSAIVAPQPAPAVAPAAAPATNQAAAPKTAAVPAPRPPQPTAPRGTPGARGPTGPNGRPSLAAPNTYRRVDVNSSADLSAAPDTGLSANEVADLTNSADPSLLVSGSVSRGIDIPQGNDWFGGPGGRDALMGGGPGGIDGMNPAGGDGAGAAFGAGAQGGGRGGPGGGMPGGGMPGGGMPGGFGGRGGGGPGGGGPGGRGGFAGRGGPMGRPGVASFGNARRDRRMQYNGNAAFTLDNSIWDARAYSINGQDTAKPAYAKARATMMFGGPLKIPKLLNGT